MIELIWSMEAPREDLAQDIERAVRTALDMEARGGDVSVQIVGADDIRTMNREFRCVDAVTDVLSFPAWEGEELLAPPDGYLGDIALCYPRALQQAEEYGHSLRRELCFLSVHGALHLCGYDHMCSEDEARMKERQERILAELGVER